MRWNILKMLPIALVAMATTASAEDKVVNVYNWSDYVGDKVLEEFTKATGIKVTYDVYDSMETLEAKLYAGSSGYDVIVPTDRNMERMIKAGILQKLDKSKIANDSHQWDVIAKRLTTYDPGNQYAENYMWGTTGIGYNVDKVKKALGDVPVHSWAIVFDPKNMAKLKDCGVTFLNSPDDLFPAALSYLGLDPNSKKEEDLTKAADVVKAVAPYVQKFNSSEYINGLANGDMCLAVGYSGDVLQARDRAVEAKNGVTIAYAIPKEGALMWFDSMVIPKDAPHRDNALAFINFMLDPKIAAENSNFVEYANGNKDSQSLLDDSVFKDPSIYPPQDVMDKLFTTTTNDQATQRIVTRLWTTVKTGQ